ncbi:MAG: AtpZ/AtpI family protein [Patescibacteria group bacterium]|jgi:F0F1-type ATP synthase assembly protein I
MKRDSWSLALRVAARLTGWVGFPVIIGVFLGKWLDKRFGTEPWLFLGTIGFCFLVSIYGLATNATKEFARIEREYKQDHPQGQPPDNKFDDWEKEDKKWRDDDDWKDGNQPDEK